MDRPPHSGENGPRESLSPVDFIAARPDGAVQECGQLLGDHRIELGDRVRRFLDSQKLAVGPAVDGHGLPAEDQFHLAVKAPLNPLDQGARLMRKRSA